MAKAATGGGLRCLEPDEGLWAWNWVADLIRRVAGRCSSKIHDLGQYGCVITNLSIPDLGRLLVATLVIFRRLCFACRLEAVESWLIKK